MSKEKNQLKSGIVLSYINLAIGSAIPFVYTPIMLRLLGQAEYGLYSLSHSITGYLSLLSFGLGSTIVRYITKYKVENDKEKEQETFGLFLIFYLILSALVIIVGGILVLCADTFFSSGLTSEELSKMKILMIIMTVNTAIAFPISVYSSVALAHERFIFERTVSIIFTIGAPLFNLIILFMGFGSIGMALVGVSLQIISAPIYILFCTRRLRLKPSFKKPEVSFLKEIVGFSFYIFLGSIVDMLFWATDKVILGALIGTVAVAIYNIGGTFNTIITQLSTTISGVLVPKITGMVVLEKSRQELSDLFVRIARLQFIIVGLVVSGFVAFGKPFLYMWAGEEYRDSYYIALLTLVPMIIPLTQSSALAIVVAQNKHKFRSLVYLGIAILNVFSTWLVVPYYGGIGAALCSCVSYVLGQGIIMNIYYSRVTKLDIPAYWKEIIKLSIIPITLCSITLLLSTIIDYYHPLIFIVGVIVYTLVYALLMFLLGMNEYEKNTFIKPIKILVSRIRKK